MKKTIQRIGLITGGGDCPGLNAAIRAVTRRADQAGIAVYGIERGFQGLTTGHVRKLDLVEVSGILTRGGTILESSRFNPFKHPGNYSAR